MVRHLRHMIRGCGYLPDYGSHPGTGILIAFVLMGIAAGAQRPSGWLGPIVGGAVMLVFFGPLYLYGAYERGRDQERRTRKSDSQ